MWLIGCQLVGEVLVRLADAPVPGPVVGMVVLLVLLRVRRSGDDATVVCRADAVRVRDERARGLALGAVSHGIGTSRALLEDETEGAFAGLSMGLTALATSILLPLLLALLL